MIKPIKDRTLNQGQIVQVYRNLNAPGKVFSIKDKKSELVLAHGDSFIIEDITCKVSEAGRQRVLRDKRKNVHAVLLGRYVGESGLDTSNLNELYYDPYTLDSFVNKTTGESVNCVEVIYFRDGKAWILD